MNQDVLPQLLNEHFQLRDLKVICFRLGIDDENLAGETKLEKIIELVRACEQNGRLAELRMICIELRPMLAENLRNAAIPTRMNTIPFEMPGSEQPKLRPTRKPVLLGFAGFVLLVVASFFILNANRAGESNGNDTNVNSEHPLEIDGSKDIDMVFVEAGSFFMGHDEGKVNHQPGHSVFLDSFWIDTYEVTNKAFQAFVDDPERSQEAPDFWQNGRFRAGLDDHPVVGVSWYDAAAYCEWNGLKRLPTEAEWEKAARGEDGRLWPWGNKWDNQKANVAESGNESTWAVGSNTRGNSPYGAADMAGNVWEWVNDWYEEDFYSAGQNRNPIGPSGFVSTNKVMRGGAWTDAPTLTQTFVRLGVFPPTYTAEQVGFRCACDDCIS